MSFVNAVDSKAISVLGYSSAENNFTVRFIMHGVVCTVTRSAHQFHVVERLAPVGKTKGFPKKPFQKLASVSWDMIDNMMPVQLTKSLAIVERWLEAVFLSLSKQQLEEFVDEDCVQAIKRQKRERKEMEAIPKQLQQYFSCDENIASVIDILFSSIGEDTSDILFVEPSCGDGRMLNALMKRNTLINTIGVDIDDTVLRRAEEASSSSGGSAHWLKKDFLSVTRQSLIELSESTKDRIVVLGNPPFTIVTEATGEKQRSSTFNYSTCARSDYPKLFMYHCMHELLAEQIVFVLPKRCDSQSFIDSVLSEIVVINSTEKYQWRLESSTQASPVFSLLEREIKQPCVIHHWRRVSN